MLRSFHKLLVWALFFQFVVFTGLGMILDGIAKDDLLTLTIFIYPVIGALIALRRPENRIGWSFLLGSVIISLGIFVSSYAIYGLEISPTELPGSRIAAAMSGWLGNLGIVFAFLIPLFLFPDGRLPSSRWKPVLLLYFLMILANVLLIFQPGLTGATPRIHNPLGIPKLQELVSVLNWINDTMGFVLFLICVLALVVRYLAGSPNLRRQIRWVVFAMFSVVLLFGVAELYRFWTGSELIMNLVWIYTVLSFPISVGLAILSSRLYDIDLIIRRTLVYTVLTVVLLLVYFGSVVLFQQFFRTLTGQESPAAIVISTLAIAALFTPLRQRIQNLIDRRFFRQRYDADQSLASFRARLQNEVDMDAINADLLSTVQDTLQPSSSALWVRRS